MSVVGFTVVEEEVVSSSLFMAVWETSICLMWLSFLTVMKRKNIMKIIWCLLELKLKNWRSGEEVSLGMGSSYVVMGIVRMA